MASISLSSPIQAPQGTPHVFVALSQEFSARTAPGGLIDPNRQLACNIIQLLRQRLCTEVASKALTNESVSISAEIKGEKVELFFDKGEVLLFAPQLNADNLRYAETFLGEIADGVALVAREDRGPLQFSLLEPESPDDTLKPVPHDPAHLGAHGSFKIPSSFLLVPSELKYTYYFAVQRDQEQLYYEEPDPLGEK